MANTIEGTFTHIAKRWPEEYYKDEPSRWENIQKMIITDPTIQSVTCTICGTKWPNRMFIWEGIEDACCPVCDTRLQPCLCNTINKESVKKYIDPKYWPILGIKIIKVKHVIYKIPEYPNLPYAP
jgi:hypothetical protein